MYCSWRSVAGCRFLMKSCRLQVGGSREAFLIMKSPCVVEPLDVHIHLGFVHSCHHLVILCKFDRRFSFSSRWGGDSLMSSMCWCSVIAIVSVSSRIVHRSLFWSCLTISSYVWRSFSTRFSWVYICKSVQYRGSCQHGRREWGFIKLLPPLIRKLGTIVVVRRQDIAVPPQS